MPGYTFHLIPHTHWDREWYLPHSIFQARLVAALDDLLARLDSESGSTFLLDGQTVLLEDYLQLRPERQANIAALVRAGRLQIGPWYVLADEQIPSGESLIRNLLAGQADSRRWGGRTDVLYSPDAFGHPAILPQLAGEFGIRFAVVWRGLGGEPGQQRDLYRWRGPDGREVLLYHLPPDGYEVGAALPADPERLPRAWARVRATCVERAASRQIPVFIGADHHAVHPGLVALCSLLARLEPASEFRISPLHDFFVAAAAEATAAPVITGELRWSYGYTWTLQGVHSTRAPLKRRHGLTELSLMGIADPMAALAWAMTGSDQRAVLNHAWRLLLQSQFHDSICGCTSDPVARRVEVRLDDARGLAQEIGRTSLNALVGNSPDRVRADPEIGEPQLVLWNPVPRRRSGVAVADLTWFRRDVLVGPPGDRAPRVGPGSRRFHLIGDNAALGVQPLGQKSTQERLDASRHYPDQDEVDSTRVAFLAPQVGGLGLVALGVGQGTRSVIGGAWIKGHTLGNEFIQVRVGRSGTLELTDWRSRQRYGELLALESSGDAGDSYSYAPPVRDRIRRHRGAVAIQALAKGPLVAALEVRWRLSAGGREGGSGMGEVGVTSIVSVYAGSPVIRYSLEIDNRALNHRLRVRVPTGLTGGPAVAGSQFGVVERTPVSVDARAYRRETPVLTAPAHRYVARASKNRGLAVLAPGFFEYEMTPRGDLLVTILRAIGQLSRDDLSTRPGHAGWPIETPMAQCQGTERLQLAVSPLTQAHAESRTALAELWEDVFLPILPVWLRQASPLSIPAIDIRLEGAGLVFSAVKPAEEGRALVLRCYNATPRPAAGIWSLSTVIAAARRARADEQTLHDIRLGEGGRSIPFHAGPHEIVTIVVTLAQLD